MNPTFGFFLGIAIGIWTGYGVVWSSKHNSKQSAPITETPPEVIATPKTSPHLAIGYGHGLGNTPESPFTPSEWTPFHEYVDLHRECRRCPLLHKWERYFHAYHQQFQKYRGKEVHMLEVGVQSGGSVLLWRWYFGDKFHYYGVDINPACQQFQNSWSQIFIGDQANKSFWKDMKAKIPKLDIFLDDGGHTMNQQIVTFEEMFDHVKPGGIFACEDLATSYWTTRAEPKNSGAMKGTMVDLTKQWIDWLNVWYVDGGTSRTPSIRFKNLPNADSFFNWVTAIHYYDQIVFLEKSSVVLLPPRTVRIGGHIIGDSPWDGSIYPMSMELLQTNYQTI